eukprot:1091588-Rhodomonas_salina.1
MRPRPFDEVLFCNIGNPHSVGQKPITFYRQVLALVDCPWLLDDPRAKELFPADAIERARYLSNFMTGGTGAYSHSQGVLAIRKVTAPAERGSERAREREKEGLGRDRGEERTRGRERAVVTWAG